MFKITKIFTLITLVFINFNVAAQDATLANNGSIATLNKFDKVYSLSQSQDLLKKVLKTDAFTSFQIYEEKTDELGFTHTRFQQYYKGIKVHDAVYFVHSQNGVISHINGDYRQLYNANAKATLSVSEALSQTLTKIAAKEYSWQNPEAEQELRYLRADSSATYLPKGELVWVRDIKASKGSSEVHRLAYYFEITATQPDLHLAVYTDAMTGEVIQQNSTVCNILGDAQTRYSGTRQIDTRRRSNGTFELVSADATDPNTIYVRTQNAKNANMFDNNNNWTQAEYRNTGDDVALDVHWGGVAAQSYWQSKYGRNGYDDKGTPLNLVARAGDGDNAYWFNDSKTAAFCDGASVFNPLTSLDVVGHELGHGFSWSWGLNSGSGGETPALHEGFSDIWGVCLSFFNNKGSWLVGHEIMKNNSCLRNLAFPKDTRAANISPNTYQGEFSGRSNHHDGVVLGHWFHLLSVGGSGRNDRGNAFNVRGISLEKAEKITYRMATQYLTPNAQYSHIAQAALQAAKDIYGICSPEVISVGNALYAVGLLNTPYIVGSTEMFEFHPIVCDMYRSYRFSARVWNTQFGLVPNTRFRWHIENNSRLSMNGQVGVDVITDDYGVNVYVDNIPNLDSHWATITATPLDCVDATPISYRFWVGKPDEIGELSSVSLCLGTSNHVSVEEIAGTEEYVWYVDPTEATIDYSHGNFATITPNKVSSVKLFLMVKNRCSLPRSIEDDKFQYTYRWKVYDLPIESGEKCNTMCNNPKLPCLYFVGFPNPATSTYTITTKGDFKERGMVTPFSYKIYNSMGVNMTENSSEDGADKQLDVSTWADGLYVIQLQSGNISQYLKFVVQKGSVAN